MTGQWWKEDHQDYKVHRLKSKESHKYFSPLWMDFTQPGVQLFVQQPHYMQQHVLCSLIIQRSSPPFQIIICKLNWLFNKCETWAYGIILHRVKGVGVGVGCRDTGMGSMKDCTFWHVRSSSGVNNGQWWPASSFKNTWALSNLTSLPWRCLSSSIIQQHCCTPIFETRVCPSVRGTALWHPVLRAVTFSIPSLLSVLFSKHSTKPPLCESKNIVFS